ncbi:hypothetical protein GOP47_0024137 [Adiantum capillus-veneris]|uniref:Uncharacterized protein n=1 Tax=Adiantum capillus-veneris TaxID=13818 RepID=A0A9D4U5Z2_ADICA|nr:hypothetical protein GOP47_0024137 [Adiantum capillus-veneris]
MQGVVQVEVGPSSPTSLCAHGCTCRASASMQACGHAIFLSYLHAIPCTNFAMAAREIERDALQERSLRDSENEREREDHASSPPPCLLLPPGNCLTWIHRPTFLI